MIREEEDVEIEVTKAKKLVRELRDRNLLDYGQTITERDVEDVTGIKKADCVGDEWEFLLLMLREIVKGEGFYITSRGRGDNLYIMKREEMAAHNEKKNKVMWKNLKQRSRALHMIDDSLLSSEQQKKLEFEILRNSSIELEMAERLRKRCRY